jgi:hypothetical protein
MVCFFSRADDVIRCEVRPGADGYELVIDRPDSLVHVERFSDADALNRRWLDVESTLIKQGWRGPGRRQHPAPRLGEPGWPA